MRMNLGACFGLGLPALDTVIKTTIRGSVWNLTFLDEGGGGGGVQEKRCWDISPDKIDT